MKNLIPLFVELWLIGKYILIEAVDIVKVYGLLPDLSKNGSIKVTVQRYSLENSLSNNDS